MSVVSGPEVTAHSFPIANSFFFLKEFLFYFYYLFIFGCVGSLFLCKGFL